jgi:hypothetical protein
VLLDSGHFVWEDRAEDYAAAILFSAYPLLTAASEQAIAARRLRRVLFRQIHFPQ